MSDKFDIRVIATDGRITKKILWIKKTKKHICYGLDILGDIGHFTYHENGKGHYKNKQAVFQKNNRIPLVNFKGILQVANISVSKDLSNLPNVDFDYKKVDGLVYVDLRTIKSSDSSFNIDFQFVEEGKKELIYTLPDHNIIHVFKFSNPWVVITV